jgi:hypothetical protein
MGFIVKPFKKKASSYGTEISAEVEPKIPSIGFKIHKFSSRHRANHEDVIIFPIFSEFGTEVLGSVYVIPRILKEQYPGRYSIVMGWWGRDFLYKELVDEFWELNEEHQWLREYCRSFRHASKNLAKLEKYVTKFGHVIPVRDLAKVALLDLFPNVHEARKTAVWTPMPSKQKMDYVRKYLSPNSVGVFARRRQCYGRNLPPEFYVKLIKLLKDMGYTPIWMGEKQTSLKCPVSDIVDFTMEEDARDMELTLAIVAQLKFTIQFWTASTRLSGLVGTPYIIFESPDQIFGKHEGYRISLCTKGDKKIVYAHYYNVLNDHEKTMDVVRRSIEEVCNNNFDDIIGMTETTAAIEHMQNNDRERVGL